MLNPFLVVAVILLAAAAVLFLSKDRSSKPVQPKNPAIPHRPEPVAPPKSQGDEHGKRDESHGKSDEHRHSK